LRVSKIAGKAVNLIGHLDETEKKSAGTVD
jgi:hypothetical protein